MPLISARLVKKARAERPADYLNKRSRRGLVGFSQDIALCSLLVSSWKKREATDSSGMKYSHSICCFTVVKDWVPLVREWIWFRNRRWRLPQWINDFDLVRMDECLGLARTQVLGWISCALRRRLPWFGRGILPLVDSLCIWSYCSWPTMESIL